MSAPKPDPDLAAIARAELAAVRAKVFPDELHRDLFELVHVLAGLLGARPEGRQR